MKKGKSIIINYILSFLLCVFAGLYLLSIKSIGNYAYAIVWAMSWYFIVALFNHRSGMTFFIALAICVILELTQLYSAPWINELRNTDVGGYLLGSAFDWKDLICYAIGATAAWLVDIWVYKKH